MDARLIIGMLCVAFAMWGPSSDSSFNLPDWANLFNRPAVTDTVFPAPSAQYMPLVNSIKAISGVSNEDKAVLAHFYADFAAVLSNDSTLVTDTVRFRSAYALAGKTLFGNKLKGKYPNLGATIDKEMMSVLGDNASKLDKAKTVDVLNAVAYAFGG